MPSGPAVTGVPASPQWPAVLPTRRPWARNAQAEVQLVDDVRRGQVHEQPGLVRRERGGRGVGGARADQRPHLDVAADRHRDLGRGAGGHRRRGPGGRLAHRRGEGVGEGAVGLDVGEHPVGLGLDLDREVAHPAFPQLAGDGVAGGGQGLLRQVHLVDDHGGVVGEPARLRGGGHGGPVVVRGGHDADVQLEAVRALLDPLAAVAAGEPGRRGVGRHAVAVAVAGPGARACGRCGQAGEAGQLVGHAGEVPGGLAGALGGWLRLARRHRGGRRHRGDAERGDDRGDADEDLRRVTRVLQGIRPAGARNGFRCARGDPQRL